MPANDLFDSFSHFGDRILHGIEQGERPATKFKYLLGSINEILGITHGMVVTVLETVERADSPAEAEAALAELRTEALEESFRLEGLCDAFDAMGRGLNDLYWRSKSNSDTVAPDLGEIDQFSMMLMDREQEVARIYSTEIKALANLGSLADDLPALRSRAAEAKKILTDQMADFATKTQLFKSVSRGR